MLNCIQFLKVYEAVSKGELISPRGQLCKEVLDYSFVLSMEDSPLTSFEDRKLNLKYAKEEFLWYLRADKFDTSIEKHATMWQKIRQEDGSYFSNYGQYIFPQQFNFVVQELERDPASRRASMVLLKQEHLFASNKDVVCTYAINFRIRNHRLDMTVMMRSNDVILGMTNDVFCFSMLYRMVYGMLMSTTYVNKGFYRHFVNSLHVYERHFAMIDAICERGIRGYYHIEIPWPSFHEIVDCLDYGKPIRGPWTSWMNGD